VTAVSTDNKAGLSRRPRVAGRRTPRHGYFPAQFPTPRGLPEAHIEAF
jgi:hypothetical protein